MFEKITSENALMFAMKHYENPHCEGEHEFYDDIKRFKYIKRLLRKFQECGELKERLILNHITVLRNVFGNEPTTILLLHKIETEHHHVLKAFLLYLNMIQEQELLEINVDLEVLKYLESIDGFGD